MLFNSYIFLFCFFPISLGLFYVTSRYSRDFSLAVLFFSSLIFYGYGNWHFVPFILFSIYTNFLLEKMLRNSKNYRSRKKILVLGLLYNLGFLGYFKYTNFLIGNFNAIFSKNIHTLDIMLPIGVSFFTFTQIAFLIDSYRGSSQKYSFWNYGLFVTYFPHLIAGPIIHHKEIMPQFESGKVFNFNINSFCVGMTLFSIGFFKKVVIADSFGPLVSTVFDTHITPSLLEAWIAVLAYTLELYLDFSGYSDMALGLSKILSIELPVNFFSPYKSTSIIEFWHRWNMTLSRFLKDYLYIPLGGNRKGSLRKYMNLMITMLLGGLWHGANWTFICWGFLHGFYLVVNNSWRQIKKYFFIKDKRNIFTRTLSRGLTFLCVVIAWVYFRSDSLVTAHRILHAMFFGERSLPKEWISPVSSKFYFFMDTLNFSFVNMKTNLLQRPMVFLIPLSFVLVWSFPNAFEFMSKFKPGLLPAKWDALHPAFAWRPSVAWGVLFAGILSISVMHICKSSIFLYFQF